MGLESESEFPIPSGRGRRCSRHGLAAGPDGLCALCRTESLPPPRPYSAWVLGGLLLAIVLVSTSALAYRALRDPPATPAPIARESAATLPVIPAPGAEQVEPPAAPPTEASRTSIAFSAPLPAPAIAALERARATTATAPSTSPRATLQARPAPSEAELRAALSSTPIVLYATTWCGACRKARAFLSENGFKYQEIDADTTPGAWDKVEQLGGRRAVPIIVVDGEVSVGLDPNRILKSTARSMERRLGITGITFRPN